VKGKRYILVIVDDYSPFTWVKFLASKDEAPNFIIKFLKMIQVRLNATVRNIRTNNETEFVNQTLRDYYEQVGISHKTSVANSTTKCSYNMLHPKPIHYITSPWKTPYELLHDRKPDLSYLHVFGALCYPNNDSENLGKHQAKADIGIFIGYAPKKKAYRIYSRRTRKIIETIHVHYDELTAMAFKQSSLEPAFHEMTLATPSSKLIPNPPPSAPYSTGTPSSTNVDQDAPSPSTSQTTPQSQSQEIPLYAEEESHDREVAHMSNDPYFGILIPDTVSKESSSTDVMHKNVQSDALIPKHLRKWTKDHPLQNIIGELSKPVSTRLQLHEQAMFCYYNSFLSSVEPKTYKDKLTKSCWVKK
ncbi:retrovirus-related pol polyprotein from transposon TNT 1-94, partial [Tanacetum coccineum]